MSGTSRKGKTLSGWTMVDSKGEAMTDDSRSVSSESSTESFGLLQDDAVEGASGPDVTSELPSENVSDELGDGDDESVPVAPSLPGTQTCDDIPHSNNDDGGVDDTRGSLILPDLPLSVAPDSFGEAANESQRTADSRQLLSNEIALDPGLPAPSATSIQGLIEKDGGLGACCEELMAFVSDAKNQPETVDESKEEEVDEDEGEELEEIPMAVDSSVPSPSFLDDENREELRQRDNSDSDSDFVQINEESVEEFEAELSHNRDGVPNRSPSIAEEFNFLGNPGGAIRDRLPVNDNNGSDRDSDFDEDVNDDTESSTEDVGDDRIESDQSDAGSVLNNNLTDVGDLSAFADIADLPLVAGNVARNYRHRPNKGLSTILNVILIVVALLTMGISIGLIMATDQEIEEWQQAYQLQAKKASTLDWTVADLNRLVQDSKDKVNAHESALKSFSKAGSSRTGSSNFFSSYSNIVSRFESCHKTHGGRSVSVVDCQTLVMPDVRLALARFRQDVKTDSGGGEDSGNSFDFSLDGISRAARAMTGSLLPRDERTHDNGEDHQTKLEELQLSLQREQERALHWQNLYLLERRQREWERDNEVLEDQRERARWEEEDEEEDRQMREKWEREEAENDRQERLLWEREDEEQDRQEREKWEKERAEIDNLECLKKLMSTANLTSFRQHLVKNWNVTAFDDFVNMSALMSSIVEMRQSVLASVQQIWQQAEEALDKMGEDVKHGKQPYLDTSVMADYLKRALSILRSQFDGDVNDRSEKFGKEGKTHTSRGSGSTNEKDRNQKGPETKHEKTNNNKHYAKAKKEKESSGIWNKTVGKMFKKTSKSLRKFVRSVTSSWSEIRSLWERKASEFMKPGQEGSSSKDIPNPKAMLSLPSWLRGTACQRLLSKEEQNVIVDLGSPCLWNVRESLTNLALQKPCDPQNRYSLACNVDAVTVWRLKKDLVKILDIDADFRAGRIGTVNAKRIHGLFSDFWNRWENSELLLRADKTWASCSLKAWSDAVYGPGGWSKSTGRNCDRFVRLSTVFTDVDNRAIHTRDQQTNTIKPMEDGDSSSSRSSLDDEDKGMKGIFDDDEFDHSGKDTHDVNSEYSSSSSHSIDAYVDDDDDFNNDDGIIHVYEDLDDADESENDDYDEEIDRRDSGENPSDEISHHRSSRNASDETSHVTSGDHNGDHYKETAWYLRRAQYRLAMRRAQEKANWFFDLSDHRDEMRKEHNMDVKSGQWVFDQAEDRETQRKKEHEADWLFDRAHDRRDQFARKWAHNGRRSQRGGKDDLGMKNKRKKMEDLAKSDWLLQKNAPGKGNGKCGGNKHGCRLNQKLNKKKNNNDPKLNKQHLNPQNKQHTQKRHNQQYKKHRQHFQKKSPKK